MIDKWDKRFLRLAEHIATWSKDPSTKVGAVIVLNRKIIATGYNGFPAGEDDDPALYADRAYKYEHIVHGEINGIDQAKDRPGGGLPFGCTLYTVPFMPCSVCADKIIEAQIVRVVAPYSDNPRWIESFESTQIKFAKNGIILDLEMPE